MKRLANIAENIVARIAAPRVPIKETARTTKKKPTYGPTNTSTIAVLNALANNGKIIAAT